MANATRKNFDLVKILDSTIEELKSQKLVISAKIEMAEVIKNVITGAGVSCTVPRPAEVEEKPID